ncbi:MAG: sulfite exporter TauE/SafE family protein, partial [Actinobacteria bacterium]|nr:sulfite exporter TauE/SafE family protein [Actinomycetota bacterium]
VQAGVGFLFLAALVPGLGLGLVKGNGAKVALILGYLPFALLLFISADQVHWGAGALVGAGSMVGALLASTLAVKKGAGWIRWVLVAAAIAAALRMLLA